MDAIIKVENLKKYFKEVKAVDDISFSVERGELFVIIPGLSEPPVRTLGATIPKNESHIFR